MNKLCIALMLPGMLMAAGVNAGENDGLLISTNEKRIAQKEQQTVNQSVSKELIAATQGSKGSAPSNAGGSGGGGGGAGGGGSSSDIMIIDPKVMAQDWIDAFHALVSRKGSTITFALKSGGALTNVTEISALPGGYLLLFTMRSVQGPRWQIVKTSDISSIGSS